MARLINGDEQALNSLMERHRKSLKHLIENIVRNSSDAEELVNETFIRVFQHRSGYKFESSFSTWLYVIGSNLGRSLLRWRTRHPEFAVSPEDAARCFSDDEEDGAALVDPAPTPREQAESDQWTEALEEALARLPEKLREPLLLVSLDSRSQAEVASRLGCTIKAVETRLYQGRRRLRKELEHILNPWRKRATRVPTSEG